MRPDEKRDICRQKVFPDQDGAVAVLYKSALTERS